MKILLLNDYGSAAGGAELITASLRGELRRRGHDARLFVSKARTSTGTVAPDYECFGTVGRLRTIGQCINLPAAFTLRRVLGNFQPDVIHVNLYLTQLSPWILPVIQGTPCVYYAQWSRAICPVGTKRLPDGNRCTHNAGIACLRAGCVPLHDWLPLMGQMGLDRWWGRAFTRVVAISRSVANQFDTFGAGHLQHAQVIHPGTPYAAPRNRLSERPTVVFAGRLVPEKGADVLLQAFASVYAENSASRLVIAGDGPHRAALEELASGLGLGEAVEFRGQLSHAETVGVIRDAWVVCVPSLWDEPFGLIAAEAQMHGVAVVASASGGLQEIVRHGETGFLVEPSRSDLLANALGLILADRSRAIALGAAGHEHAAIYFSVEAFTDRFEAVYRSLLSGRSAVV